MDGLAEFEDLWEAPPDRYVLVRVGDRDEDGGLGEPVDRMAVIVDDDEVAPLVVQRMRAAGFKVVDQLPPER